MVKYQTVGVRLTFPEVDLEGQEMSFDLVAHQVLQGDQELHRLLQRVLRLVREVNRVTLLTRSQKPPAAQQERST